MTRERNANPHGRALVALSLLLVCRLSFASLPLVRPQLALANDTDRYVPIANGILARTAYAWNTDHPGELLNTVGYPLFLAAVYLTLGHSAADVCLAQLLITGLLALFIYLGLARSVGVMPAAVAALIVAADPLTMLWSLTILTETLLAVSLGMAALALVTWARSPHWGTLTAAGLLLGVASLVKPYALLIGLVWSAAILVLDPHRGSPRLASFTQGFRRMIVFITPVLVLVLPWMVRNALLWNCVTLSSVDRVTMRDYVAAKIVEEVDHIPLNQAQAMLQAQDPGVCPQDGGKYLDMVLSHPQTYIRLHLTGTIPVLIGTSFDRWLEYFGVEYVLPDLWRPFMDHGISGLFSVLRQELGRAPAALVLLPVLTGWQLVVYALALTGVLAYWRVDNAATRWSILVLVTTILVLLLTPGQGGHERFRVPAMPLLAILAAYGIKWELQPLLARHHEPVKPPDVGARASRVRRWPQR
jgi:hypothetical protein